MHQNGALEAQVMAGIEHLMSGDGKYLTELPDDAQHLVLLVSARALAEFCDANAGRHEQWGMDEATWAHWIQQGRHLVFETERLLGPWLDAWIDGRVEGLHCTRGG